MTSAQHSDNLSRAEETKRDLGQAPIRVKESLASVHASLLAKHVSYAVLIEIAEVFRRPAIPRSLPSKRRIRCSTRCRQR